MAKKYFVLRWLSVFIWAAFIFYLSSIPELQSGFEHWIDTILRKGAHMTVFGILGCLLWRASGSFRWALLLGICYAISDEFHQSFVVGRSAHMSDVIVDTLGILLFLWLCKQIKKLAPIFHRS